MTDSEKLDALVADVAFLKDVVAKMGWGGPRILPGNGSSNVLGATIQGSPNVLGSTAGLTPPPPGSPLANAMASESLGGTILAGYASSNPGPNVQPTPAAPSVDHSDDFAFDWNVPNSFRIFRTNGPGGVSKVIAVPPGYNGRVILHTGDTGGNVVDVCNLIVTDETSTISKWDRIPVRYQVLDFPVVGGHTYTLTVSAEGTLAMVVRAEPA